MAPRNLPPHPGAVDFRPLDRSFAEGLEARVVGDGADGDAQPGVHARLDAFERVELLRERERSSAAASPSPSGDGVVDGAQRALELAAQGGDARVDAAGGGGVAEHALAVALLGAGRDRGQQAVDLGGVHEVPAGLAVVAVEHAR